MYEVVSKRSEMTLIASQQMAVWGCACFQAVCLSCAVLWEFL